jgi:nucleotide-binding universal stress UspA family protein
MSIVKILVPVSGSARDEVALATAFLAAKLFAAHVETLFVHPDPREAIPYSEVPLSPQIVQDIVDNAAELRKRASTAARREFQSAAAALDVKVTDGPARLGGASASYREVVGHLGPVAANAAILSDLVVFPPVTGLDNTDVHDAFVRVLTKVGRPVLLSAEKKPEHIGRRVAVGWDGRSAAANALVSSLPVLEKAEMVELLSIGQQATKDHSINEAYEYLTLHEIRCSERVMERGVRPVAVELLETAARSGCDLLIVGGYGHSRLVESIFGGVTDSIVSHPLLPILMVH